MYSLILMINYFTNRKRLSVPTASTIDQLKFESQQLLTAVFYSAISKFKNYPHKC